MDSAPETGLSEWTSRIKDMHRPAESTQDLEQKRLEDEIAASRLARLRRSRGVSKTDGLDLSKNKEYSSALRSDTTSADDTTKSQTDRQKSQTETLNKLMGSASVPPQNRPEPMSLAAFIGGKATGPRLNKHAPQQDAHDPTQFVQRTRIDAPHPIFGTGGIAMPGMARSSAPREADQPPVWSRTGRTPEPRNRRLSTPSPEKAESPPPVSPQKTTVRERTVSTPTGLVAPRNGHHIAAQSSSSSSGTPRSNPSAASTSRPSTPGQHSSPSSPPLSKSPVVTPSLARPIQPDPRTSPHGPQISLSEAPSLAFSKSLTKKDPTPSISRLQGRGFVQNMVKASSQLESPPSSPAQLEKNRPSGGRKSSVLDRWPGAASTSPPPSPTTAAPIRRSRTTEPATVATPPSAKFVPISKSYSDSGKAKVDEPISPAGHIPGLGSANTVVVIQPKVLDVDEFGFKRESDPSPHPSKAEPSKPLNHPTKDRAKKPKKHKGDGSVPPPSVSTAAPSASTGLLDRQPATESSSRDSPKPAPTPNPPQGAPLPSVGDAFADRQSLRSNSTVSLKSTAASDAPSSSTASSGGSGIVGRRALPGMTTPHSLRSVSPKPTYDNGPDPTPSLPASSGGGSGMVGRRALPGMTTPQSMLSVFPKPAYSSVGQLSNNPAPRALPGLASAASLNATTQDDTPTFVHSRVSSTGRPTAMDVAQAFVDPPPRPVPSSAVPEPPAAQDQAVELPTPRPRNMMPPSAEKRKSSYERYSVILPPLKEEATPDPTPVSTLTRAAGNTLVQPDFDEADWKLLDQVSQASEKSEPDIVHLNHVDEPLPRVDLSPVIKRHKVPDPNPDAQTIQVDVMAITGSSASPIANPHIFYDTEMLAVIYRFKSKSTGLISSTVWSWQGKNSSLGNREEQKVAELAKRYGTSAVPVSQFSEPVELVRCLGGTLAVRQGTRTHWASENTAMHVIRSMHGVIYIDQVDISIKNICSGFSYCVSLLSTLYVWHGCGSPPEERKAALDYARSLTSNPDDIVILVENESDDDEMFWMVLGTDTGYAKADYWKWRSSMGLTPVLWSVDAGRTSPVSHLSSFNEAQSPHSSVYLVDCVFEYFVLIPSDARGKRRDIRLALTIAKDASTRLASARPYPPTVHALILPSQIPLDLRVQFRDLEHVFLAGADAPDHMNILPFETATEHLQTSSWNRSQLKDRQMLPLGLDESHLA